MTSSLNPYINFKDNAREAMEFYKTVFGGTLEFSTFEENGMGQDPSEAKKIMHSSPKAANGILFMAADTPGSMTPDEGYKVKMSLSGDNEAELTAYYEKLAEGGQITLPMAKAPWGDTFGMCIDKFGVSWMVNILATV